MAIYVTDEEQERVILVGVELDPADDCEKSLEELSELAKTAGSYSWKDDTAKRQLPSCNLYRKRKA